MLTVMALSLVVGQLTPPPPPPAPAPPPDLDAPWVHVTLRGQPGVKLGRIPTASRDISLARYWFLDERPVWECDVPCGRQIRRADDTFLVGGSDLADSETFTLAGNQAVIIDVRSGYKALKPLGVLSIVFGSIGLGAGLIMSLIGASQGGFSYYGPNFLVPGIISAGVGAVLLVGGIISVNFSKTRVDVSVAPAGAPEKAATVATFWRD